MASLKFGQIVRQFSTTAIRQKLAKPPVQVYGIDGRYAAALYSAAFKQKKLEVVEKDLKSLNNTMTADVKFRDYMNNPTEKIQDKQAILASIAKKQNFSELTLNLFGIMAENGRLNRIAGVADAYSTIMSAVRGEVYCVVTVAKPLDAATLKELKTILQGFLEKGQTLHLTTKVDSSLMGGMKVDFPERSIDMSMSSKLNLYTKMLSQPV